MTRKTETQFGMKLEATIIALIVAAVSAMPARAELFQDKNLNVQYSEDGKSAKFRAYNVWLFFSLRVTFTDSKQNVRGKFTVNPKSWSQETDSLPLPCTVLVEGLPPSNGGQWTRTIEPRGEPDKHDQGIRNHTPESTDLLTDKPAVYDRIQMKNGDKVSGLIQNDALTIKTSYASLKFSPDKLTSVEFEGAGANLDKVVLRVGDKLSGVLETPKITIKLTAGGDAEIDKDKIKLIRFRDKVDN